MGASPVPHPREYDQRHRVHCSWPEAPHLKIGLEKIVCLVMNPDFLESAKQLGRATWA